MSEPEQRAEAILPDGKLFEIWSDGSTIESSTGDDGSFSFSAKVYPEIHQCPECGEDFEVPPMLWAPVGEPLLKCPSCGCTLIG